MSVPGEPEFVCPNCRHGNPLSTWLDLASRAAPDPHRWIWSECRECGRQVVLAIQPPEVNLGLLDGFPAPSFIPVQREIVDGLEVEWRAKRIDIGLAGRRYRVRR